MLVCLRTHPKNLDDTGDDPNLFVILLIAISPLSQQISPYPFTLPDLLAELLNALDLKPYIEEIKASKDIHTCTADYVEAYQRRPASLRLLSAGLPAIPWRRSLVSDAMLRSRLDEGIKNGWKPGTRTVLGAIRWYYRPQIGANPQLSDLYGPIIRTCFER